ncbi:V-type ATPase subunit [Geodermatophilus sp. DSM 44513]|uniref:V-type ATPase subunit n=1 Tax=Geodermatophilus sp. DSM 44513 TaxID=1528104 RepID=UPI001281FEFF|nr:V-type ATPase subunit [Geodermatophilus sp. DSM 44513]WNV77812.1 V-type ATPase subunit [Geodermatophilus sp. DSM 44513]
MSRPDLVTGNTRLRARRTALLDAGQLARLAERDRAGLAADLRATAYGPLLGSGPVDRPALLRAVEERRREALRGVRTVYRGEAAEVVGVLLARYDLADTLTLLRGAAHDLPDDDVLPALHCVGALTPAGARHVVAEEAEAVVHRLAAARLPDPETAAAARRAWERYLLHGDLAELELTVARAATARADRLLAAVGRPAAPLRAFLAAERDAANLLTALRLARAGTADPGAVRAQLLLPGTVPERVLLAVAAGGDPGAAAPAAWRADLARALGTGDLPGLARTLEQRRLAAAAAGWRTGDPLGVAVPLGYVAAVEEEARQLRELVTLAAGPRLRPADPAAREPVGVAA